MYLNIQHSKGVREGDSWRAECGGGALQGQFQLNLSDSASHGTDRGKGRGRQWTVCTEWEELCVVSAVVCLASRS